MTLEDVSSQIMSLTCTSVTQRTNTYTLFYFQLFQICSLQLFSFVPGATLSPNPRWPLK